MDFAKLLNSLKENLGLKERTFISPLAPDQPSVKGAATVNPESEIIKQRVLNFYRAQMPPSMQNTPLQDYYPVVKDLDAILAKDKIRKGAGGLGALQAFFESTGGRASNNYFGAKPGGRSGAQFPTPRSAIEYQYGPSMLGGGVANRLNILNKRDPINRDDIIKLYKSYNPEGDYLPNVLSAFAEIYK